MTWNPHHGCPDDDEPFEVVVRDRGHLPPARPAPEPQPAVYGSYGGGYRVPLDEVRRQVAERRERHDRATKQEDQLP